MKSLHKKEEKENNSKILLGKVYSNFAAPVAVAELGSSLHYDRFVPARSSAEERVESSPVGRSSGLAAGRVRVPGRERQGSSLPPSRHGN